jgi:hypothetical protein
VRRNEDKRSSYLQELVPLGVEDLHHLTAAKLLPDDDLLGRIDAVDLKHVLGDIQTDCGNLHVDGSLMWLVATITLRRFVAGSGRRPPHQEPTFAG